MCGIFCALSTGNRVAPSEQILERLRSRGPDSVGTEHARFARSSNAEDTPQEVLVTLCSTVLSLRGSQITSQPYQDPDRRYTLCWNGEAWRVDGELATGNDTATIHGRIVNAIESFYAGPTSNSRAEGASAIANALSCVAGPYAFVFYDHVRGKLYFGRDFLGRRSLCWRIDEEGNLIICSVSDGRASPSWQEVDATGVFTVDLQTVFRGPTKIPDEVQRQHYNLATSSVPYRFADEQPSVLPRLSLNRMLPSSQSQLSTESMAVTQLYQSLQDSLRPRVVDIPEPRRDNRGHGLETPTKLAILFSGGLDCTVLARICHDLLPPEESIDLLNVAFENPRVHANLDTTSAYELCPDRMTGRSSFAELHTICHRRRFRFVAINVPYSETLQHREEVISLMHPHNTEMDLSIAYALYFAARGVGEASDPVSGDASSYTTPARVLLSGLGADELFGGYTRHATAFRRAGFLGLLDELELDVARLGKRNLGRDDRVISHWGKEARFPFLDEALLSWALSAPVNDKCGFGESLDDGVAEENGSQALEPGKKVLRCLAWKLGMQNVAKEPKRAIQFGARTAKMEKGKTKGTQMLS